MEGALQGELSEHAGAGGGTDGVEVTLVESRDRFRHARDTVGRGEHADALVDELRKGAGAGCHHRTPARHGFQDHQPERLLGAGVDQRIRGGDPLRQLEAVAPVGQHGDVGGGARLALPADQQQVVRRSEACESLQQHRQSCTDHS